MFIEDLTRKEVMDLSSYRPAYAVTYYIAVFSSVLVRDANRYRLHLKLLSHKMKYINPKTRVQYFAAYKSFIMMATLFFNIVLVSIFFTW